MNRRKFMSGLALAASGLWVPRAHSASLGLLDTGFIGSLLSPGALAPLAAWWKADSLNLADNTALGVAHPWLDSSGSGHNLNSAQGTISFRTNQVGVLPGISFPGGGGLMTMATDLVLAANFTICAAYKSAAGADGFLMSHSSVSPQVRVNRSGANQVQFFDGTTEAISPTLSTLATSRRLITWKRTSGAVTFLENNTPRTGGTASLSATFDQICGGISYAGFIYEIAVWTRALTDGQVQSLYNSYFKPRWGLP